MKKKDTNTLSRGRVLRKAVPYLMVMPAVIFLVVFTFIPIMYLFVLSFFKYNLISDMQFIGMENYKNLFFVEAGFWVAARNTVIYTVSLVIFLTLFSLLLAVALEKSSLLNAFAQRLMFLPHLCATLTVAMIFQWLMNEEGMFNAVLGLFKLPGLRWLNSSDTALFSIIIIACWKDIGYYTIIMLSSLKAIPAEINEAAELDNAGFFRRFFKITLPMVSPQLFFLLITITMGAFKVFDMVRILTEGGPGNSTDSIVYWIYKKAFTGTLNLGLASAASVVLMGVMMIMTVIYFNTINKKVHYQ